MIRTMFIVAVIFGAFAGAEENARTPKAEKDSKKPQWVDISTDFLKKIGTEEVKTVYLRRCIGMLVTPTGDIFIQTATKGVCVSTDQGATWSVVEGNTITGSCHVDSVSMPYPYDGRMAIFTMDGTGGISLDAGKTWRPFGRFLRNLQYADVDWSQGDPQTILGMTHEPFYTVLSNDGGRTWRRTADEENGKAPYPLLGVFDSKTLLRAPAQGLEKSTDAGRTWARVADYKVSAVRPVHYGKKVYWGTTEGVIVSSNGTDWVLTGKGATNIYCGPYFGSTEQQFMVVTDKAFVATQDGGKTWRELAPVFRAPGIFKPNFHAQDYYGWDAERKILYTTGLSTEVYQLRLSE